MISAYEDEQLGGSEASSIEEIFILVMYVKLKADFIFIFYCLNWIVFHFIAHGSSEDKRKKSPARQKKLNGKSALKDEWLVNALRAQNLARGHFLGHEIRLVFVSLSIWAILSINWYYYPFIVRRHTWFSIHNVIFSKTRRCFLKYTVSK